MRLGVASTSFVQNAPWRQRQPATVVTPSLDASLDLGGADNSLVQHTQRIVEPSIGSYPSNDSDTPDPATKPLSRSLLGEASIELVRSARPANGLGEGGVARPTTIATKGGRGKI